MFAWAEGLEVVSALCDEPRQYVRKRSGQEAHSKTWVCVLMLAAQVRRGTLRGVAVISGVRSRGYRGSESVSGLEGFQVETVTKG